MQSHAAILRWFRSLTHLAVRPRLGSLCIVLAFGWPLILPGLLALQVFSLVRQLEPALGQFKE